MKVILITMVAAVFFSFTPHNSATTLPGPVDSIYSLINQNGADTLQSIRILNKSSLKRLPNVIRDLSIALNESAFQLNGLLNKKGFTVHLTDVHRRDAEISAAVVYQHGDSVFQLKLSYINKRASDKALAVTLLHEIMHCVLLDIDRNARLGDNEALARVKSFDSILKPGYNSFNNSFFFLMNSGEKGQHELMYRLFYPGMVALLEQFAKIHKDVFNESTPDLLMWSGLQKTVEYEKLSYEERREIETAILTEKGLYYQ